MYPKGLGLIIPKKFLSIITPIITSGVQIIGEHMKTPMSSRSFSSSTRCDVSDYRRVQEIFRTIEQISGNIYGLVNNAAIEQMLAAGVGSIVNISSVAGLNPFRTRTSYNASKSGMIGLTESMALDFADRNLRVNAVCPGYVRTELTAPLFERLGRELFEHLVSAHAMKRLGRPEEISRAVLFLLSEEASFITGVALPVDGGYLLKG